MEPGNTEHYLEQLNLTELMEQLNRCFSSAFLADFIGFIAARHPVGAGLLPDGKL